MAIDPHKLLLVEDDPNDIELIQLALQDADFIHTLDIAWDGEAALQYLHASPTAPSPRLLPRVVLMDLKLPKLTGLEVLQAIRAHPETRYLPVVIMTSSAEAQDLAACYNLWVNSYVVKDLDSQQFQALAQQIGTYWMTANRPMDLLMTSG